MSKLLIVSAVVLLLIGAGYIFFSKTGKKTVDSQPVNVAKPNSSISPAPSPFLFEELTIPYLRNRDYKSALGESEKNYETASYTAYLASYDSDGLKINGLLTEPKGEKPAGGWPAIIFIHGYIPPSLYKTTQNYYDYVDYLAKNGYVVFKIDLRGHDESEGEAGGAYYSADYIIDVLNAYSALQNSGFVNPEKIGLWGHSMAGNVVLRTLAVKTDIPAASIWAGAVYTYKDFAEFGIRDGSYRPPVDQTARQQRRKLLMDTYGEPKDGNPFWDLVAATNYLNDFKSAIQLNHAVNDDVVGIGYSRGLNGLLDKTTIPHELNEYPSGGHNISNPGFTPAMQNTVNFFNKFLK